MATGNLATTSNSRHGRSPAVPSNGGASHHGYVRTRRRVSPISTFASWANDLSAGWRRDPCPTNRFGRSSSGSGATSLPDSHRHSHFESCSDRRRVQRTTHFNPTRREVTSIIVPVRTCTTQFQAKMSEETTLRQRFTKFETSRALSPFSMRHSLCLASREGTSQISLRWTTSMPLRDGPRPEFNLEHKLYRRENNVDLLMEN